MAGHSAITMDRMDTPMMETDLLETIGVTSGLVLDGFVMGFSALCDFLAPSAGK